MNNLSRSHSQSETYYRPQKHKAQNTQVFLDNQPFTLPRKEAKAKELRKPSYENLISPNRFELLLSCDKNENENLDHREKSKAFHQIDFKVTQPSVSEKSSLNSNASIVKLSMSVI